MERLRFTKSEVTAICVAAYWHRATAIDLIAKRRPGVSRDVIEAAVETAFETAAKFTGDDPDVGDIK